MKRRFSLAIAVIATMIGGMSLVSCNDQPPYPTFTATVTVKPVDGGGFFMEQDDSTALVATNMSKYPYPGFAEKRAMVMYNLAKSASSTSVVPGYKFVNDVVVARMDTILTKNPVKSFGSEAEDAQEYGSDPLGIYLQGVFPCTMTEDGYLQVSFTYFGAGQLTHSINLVSGSNPDNPYEFVLRHDSHGEPRLYRFSGLVEFPLKEIKDKSVKEITLVWNSLVTDRKESVKIPFTPRTDWPE